MKPLVRNAFLLGAGAVLVTYSGLAPAYKLSARSTPEERRLSGIGSGYWTDVERAVARMSVTGFTEPVHEEITNRIYRCEGDREVCAGDRATTAPAAVLAGVRWNDDPPFRMAANQSSGSRCKRSETIRFETQPICWATLFEDANRRAARNESFGAGDAILYRTHFGDLQFLHAMASRDGEAASETQAKLMGWFEFSWRASMGEFTLDTRLKDVQIPVVQAAFGHSEWRLLDLYTQGAGGGLRRELKDVAFGSLLHALEDSYAAGHVDREESSGTSRCLAGSIGFAAPGVIREFHAYNHQDHSLHGEADSREAFMRRFQEPGNVVEVGRGLVDARNAGMKWEEVSPLFSCVVAIQRSDAPAGPGDFTAAAP